METIRAKSAEHVRWFTRPPVQIRHEQVDFRGRQCNVEILDFLGESAEHYTQSFGLQWAKYRRAQIDRFNGTHISLQHLTHLMFGKLDALKGRTILEVGSGAGRFTDLLVDLGNTVCTVDASAIFANVALGADNLIAVRGDLFDIPIKRDLIDIVICRGVAQHTKNPSAAIARLFDYVKPGGLVVFDIYHFKWFTPLTTKYWLRPITRRIPSERFIRLAEKWVPRLMKFRQNYVTRFLPDNKLGTNIGNQIVPIADYSRSQAITNWQDRIDWSILDTVDMYTPRYDRPMTWNGVMRTLQSVGAQHIEGDRSAFIFNATAP